MQVPVDTRITIDQLTRDPYPLYRVMRADTPVLKVESVGRILLTKAEDTRYVKLTPERFSSDDPDTPMERAFQAKTLMRRDGEDHMRLRAAMMPAFSIPNIKKIWIPAFRTIVEVYGARLPRGEVVDFFPAFAGPVAARCLAQLLGIDQASDEQMQRWSQTLIDGAGVVRSFPGYDTGRSGCRRMQRLRISWATEPAGAAQVSRQFSAMAGRLCSMFGSFECRTGRVT